MDSPTPDCSTNPTKPSVPNFISAPSGTRLPVTPKFKATATARYSWPALTSAKAHVQAGLAYQSSASASLRQLLLLVGAPPTLAKPEDFRGRIKSSTTVDFAAGLATWLESRADTRTENITYVGIDSSSLIN